MLSAVAQSRLRRQKNDTAPTPTSTGAVKSKEEIPKPNNSVLISLPKAPRVTPDVLHNHGDHYILQLSSNDAIAVAGVYAFAVLGGAARIYDATLRASSQQLIIYAPMTHSVPTITALAPNTVVNVTAVSNDFGFPPDIGVLGVWDFPRNHYGADELAKQRSMEFFDLNKEDSREKLSLQDTRGWEKIIHSLLSDGPIARHILVAGGKRAGKSSFVVSVINRFLTEKITLGNATTTSEIFLLDLDTTQPLLRPSGVLYLAKVRDIITGPAFTQQMSTKNNFRAQIMCEHYVTKEQVINLGAYIRAVIDDLLKHVEEHCRDALLIIDAPEWVIATLKPDKSWGRLLLTDVVKVHANEVEYKKPEVDLLGCLEHRVAGAIRPPKTPNRDLQLLQMQAYFHSRNSDEDRLNYWSMLPVLACSAYSTLDYEGPNASVHAFYIPSGKIISSDELVFVLAESIVALMAVEAAHFDEVTRCVDAGGVEENAVCRIEQTQEGLPLLRCSSQLAVPFDVSRTECLGMAYIDSVQCGNDISYGHLVIYTPLATEERAPVGYKVVGVIGNDLASWIAMESQI